MKIKKEAPRTWFKVSLRLFSKSYRPEQITSYLKFQPTLEALKGTHFRGDPKYGKYKSHYWLYSVTQDASVPFEKQIASFFKKLGPRKVKLRTLLKKPGIHGDLFLGFSSQTGMGGAELSPAITKEIGVLGLKVSLDLYPINLFEDKELSQYKEWIEAYLK